MLVNKLLNNLKKDVREAHPSLKQRTISRYIRAFLKLQKAIEDNKLSAGESEIQITLDTLQFLLKIPVEFDSSEIEDVFHSFFSEDSEIVEF